MEQTIAVLFLIGLLIAILIRRRISMQMAKRIALASVAGFVIGTLGFLFMDRVSAPGTIQGVRTVGWILGTLMLLSFLAVPFAVSGYVSSRLVGAQ